MFNKKYLWCLLAALICRTGIASFAQTSVSVGSGSYASFPPPSENDSTNSLYNFVYNQKINVGPSKSSSPIPTNDWWTDLVINGANCGMLWAYPLSADPDATGMRLFFANSFNATGSSIVNGGYVHVGAKNFTNNKGFAKDWSDWGLVMSHNDSVRNRSMDVTMAHGIPFMWYETSGINPEFTYDSSFAYMNADGSPLTLPCTTSFVIKTDNRYFGVHMPGNRSANIAGKQFVRIDLGSVQSITKLKLKWGTTYGTDYTIQTSNNDTVYATQASITGGDGSFDSTAFSGLSARYVKILLNKKNSNTYGYAIYEWSLYNGTTLLSKNKPVVVSSTKSPWLVTSINDGNNGTHWESDPAQVERMVINCDSGSTFFVMSALPDAASLSTYETYAFNKVTKTKVSWAYNITAGTVATTWDITTSNLKGGSAGPTIQGFLPHLYYGAANSVSYTGTTYVSPRGTMKTAIGNSFSFTYNFQGITPNFTAPYKNTANSAPYNADDMFSMLSTFAKKTGYGTDTYWGGKDLVNYAKFTLMAKELNHEAYASLKAKTREALVNWLTYTPSETSKFYARYDRWHALIGFNSAYGSDQFTDNHFHYGYLVMAGALYGTIDPDFITQYGPMLKMVAKQYANYDRTDTTLPFFRTFDPWIGHSYAGGRSSSNGNNQESTSEAMQSWVGLFLLGDVMGDADMRAAGAFGYSSESNATLEYWFDWKDRNLPAAYAHNIVGILSNSGYAYATYFGANPAYIHGIQYLPMNPGFKYLGRDSTWAAREYSDLMAEELAKQNHHAEPEFGDDWAHAALGFRQFWDPGYVANFMQTNLTLSPTDTNCIMDYQGAGMTYYYTHARQNLGRFSSTYRTSFPSSSCFENGSGGFYHAVAYNPSTSAQTCTVYNAAGSVVATFLVPARTLITYPALPTTGQQPTNCYNLAIVSAWANGGNAASAVDGNTGTRWQGSQSDPTTFIVNMGDTVIINKLTIKWQNANAGNYVISSSKDSVNWTTIVTRTGVVKGDRTEIIDSSNGLPLNQVGRYIKIYATTRNYMPYGVSIYEINVCGKAAAVPPVAPIGTVLPALIQAEAFADSSGINTEGTTDFGGGRDVDHIDPGDWVEYKVNSPTNSNYNIKFRVSNQGSASTLTVKVDGNTINTINIPATGGWQTWTYAYDTIPLVAGNHTIRLQQATLKCNINWFDVQLPTNTLHIEAENYSAMSGVATGTVTDIDGGLYVKSIDNNDYMDYIVNVPAAGTYTVKYRLASPNNGGVLNLKLGGTTLATTTVPNTGAYQTWTTVSTTATFAAGSQTFRLQASPGGFNLNWWEIVIPIPQRLAATDEPSVAEHLLKMYPNPASGTVNIFAPDAADFKLSDVSGHIVKEGPLNAGTNAIDILGLPAGMYIMRVGNKPYKLLIDSTK